MTTNVCGETAATPRHFGIYVYILVALGIIGGKHLPPLSVIFFLLTFIDVGMSGTLTGLFFAHRKQRDVEREKRAQYWREQVRQITLS